MELKEDLNYLGLRVIGCECNCVESGIFSIAIVHFDGDFCKAIPFELLE